jgi:hypothetical protein
LLGLWPLHMRLFRPFLLTVSWLLGCADVLVLTPYPDAGARSRQASDAGELEPPRTSASHESVRESADRADSSQQLAANLPALEARFGTARDPACDLNGYWAAKQLLINQSELAGEQKTAQWSYLVLVQHGEDLTTVDHHECGLFTRGLAEAAVPRDTLQVLASRNSWRGRKGRVQRVGEQCQISFQRAWLVRGADPSTFLPGGVFGAGELDSQQTVPLPTRERPLGAENWNGGTLGKVGLAMSISGATSGTRWTTQRLYSEWFTSEHYPVEAAHERERLTLGAAFDSETHVLSVEPPSPLLESVLPRPDGDNPQNSVELLFLGRDARAAPAAAVVRERNLVERCLYIQNALLPY